MNIQLKHWQVTQLEMTSKNIDTFSVVSSSGNLDLEVGNAFVSKTHFNVSFKLNLFDDDFSLQLQARFDFELDDEMSEDFKSSHFPVVNAPAISFPYLRAYISNLTLQSGIKPIILPSINFVELHRENIAKLD